MSQPTVIIIMGVSGSGKTTIGRRLAEQLGWNFHDADDDHAPESISRMKRGEPLTAGHRGPWLATLAERIRRWCEAPQRTVLACSALTSEWRAILAGRCAEGCVVFVHLQGDFDLLRNRMDDRDHIMPGSLLRSQFDTLEPPAGAVEVDASEEPDAIVQHIRNRLKV